MTYFRESEPGGPYLDNNGKYIPHEMEEEFYKTGMMNPSSRKDYELNKAEVKKVTKRLVDMIKSVRNMDGNTNF
jgi:hypothetical protein